MNPQDYIIEKLNLLHFQFCNATIKYEYYSYSSTHIIEITPKDIYNSESYIDEEIVLEEEFSKLYPTEELLFVSEDSLCRVKNPIYEIRPEPVIDFNPNFLKVPIITEFIESLENEFNHGGETNYALAA